MDDMYINKLKLCVTENDVRRLFKDKIFPNGYGSNFNDNRITVMGQSMMPSSLDVKLYGLQELAFRVIFFLKVDDKLNGKPQNSGSYSYFYALLSAINGLFKENEKVISFADANSESIDRYISYLRKTDIKDVTISKKIATLSEWINFGNKNLPYFLQLDENILRGSQHYQKVIENARDEKEHQNIVGSPRKPYPLRDLKVLMSDFMNYIELYSEDVLKVAKLHVNTKDMSNAQKYSKSFDYFMNTRYEFKEPTLKKLQEQVRANKTKYINKDRKNLGPSIKGLRDIMIEAINKLELSCGSVILMMTGMRLSEFSTLERNPTFSEDEHFHLTRVVYKTASTPEGETLEMPVPIIAKKALEILSELAEIKDGKKAGRIFLNSIELTESKDGRGERVGNMMDRFVQRLGIDEPPTPHQFRHAMAFLIVHINEKDGLELAKLFLGHKSIVMTLRYMGHFNEELKEAIDELGEEESKILVDTITGEIQNNKKIYGKNGSRLSPSHKFVGKQASEFVMFMKKGLLKLIEDKKLAIIQTPVCLCIHDLSKAENMACQRGFDIANIEIGNPIPSRCIGANCGNAIFLEQHVEELGVYDNIEPNLKARLEENTYFMENGGFNNDPFRRIVEEHKKYKKEAI